MELSLNSLLHTKRSVAPDRVRPKESGSHEGTIESMAEELVVRIARLQKRLDSLHGSGISQKEKKEIRKWADKENGELLNLKNTIMERKQSYLQTLSLDDMERLANRHPVWMVDFDMYLDQIGEVSLTYEAERAVVQFTLEPPVLKALQIYHYAAGGDLKYEDRKPHKANGARMTVIDDVPHPSGKFIFHPSDGSHAQWIFSGERWGFHDNVIWLDFGRKKERTTFLNV